MRKAMLAGLVVLLALTTAASAATPRPEGKSRVRLLDPAPLTLQGVAFEPLERVRLRVELGDHAVTRVLRATRAGGFTTTYPALRYTRCNGSLAVTATGRMGSRVSWELVSLECPNTADA